MNRMLYVKNFKQRKRISRLKCELYKRIKQKTKMLTRIPKLINKTIETKTLIKSFKFVKLTRIILRLRKEILIRNKVIKR